MHCEGTRHHRVVSILGLRFRVTQVSDLMQLHARHPPHALQTDLRH